MSEEIKDETPTEPAQAESKEPAKESEAPAEPASTEVVESKNELKDLKEIVEKQAKELTEIKALLKKPIHKSLAEPQVKDNPANQKVINPLDVIA